MLRQKRRAVSPYKRPDNCNGVGRNLANRYQANRFPPDFKDDVTTMMAARFSHGFPVPACGSGMFCSLDDSLE